MYGPPHSGSCHHNRKLDHLHKNSGKYCHKSHCYSLPRFLHEQTHQTQSNLRYVLKASNQWIHAQFRTTFFSSFILLVYVVTVKFFGLLDPQAIQLNFCVLVDCFVVSKSSIYLIGGNRLSL